MRSKEPSWLARTRRFAVQATLLLGCSCGDGDGAPNDGKTGGKTVDLSSVEGFAQGLARAMCENLFECRLGYDDASQMRALLGDIRTCTKAVATRIGDGKQPFIAGVEWGKYTYQATRAESCLARFAHQCFIFEAEEPEDAFDTICAEVFEGSVSEGAACKLDTECAGDSYCDNDGGFSQCSEGVCLPRVPQGAPCTLDNQCSTGDSPGVLCTGSDDTPGICVHASQVTHVESGARCGVIIEGELATLALCSAGLVCAQGGESEDDHCAPPPAAKSDCSTIRECEPGSICLNTGAEDENGDNLRVCVPFMLQGEGESCTNFDAPPSQIDRLLLCEGLPGGATYCDDTSHCARALPALEGESCEERECAQGLACVFDFEQEAELCLPMVAMGEPCMEDSQCPNGGVCQDPASQGNEVCTPDPCQ